MIERKPSHLAKPGDIVFLGEYSTEFLSISEDENIFLVLRVRRDKQMLESSGITYSEVYVLASDGQHYIFVLYSDWSVPILSFGRT